MDQVLAGIKVQSLLKVLPDLIKEERAEAETLREANPELAAWHRGRINGFEVVLSHLKELEEDQG
jgi:hypothetical protein